MKEELVLAVPRVTFDTLGAFQGLCFDVDRYLPTLLDRRHNCFLPRGAAEHDPGHKQIIPYVILTHAGRVLSYVRGRKAGETRLVAKGSIGFGGHINDGDEGLFALDEAAYASAVRREVGEELRLGSAYRERVAALLNDDSNEVGRVHLGVVHVWELAGDDVRKGEGMITELRFLSREELQARRESLETWSQLCLDSLDALLLFP